MRKWRGRTGRRGRVLSSASARSAPRFPSDRERVAGRLPRWVAKALGPFPDEVGWPNVIARWVVFGGLAGLGLQSLRVAANPWPAVCYALFGMLILIGMLTA